MTGLNGIHLIFGFLALILLLVIAGYARAIWEDKTRMNDERVRYATPEPTRASLVIQDPPEAVTPRDIIIYGAWSSRHGWPLMDYRNGYTLDRIFGGDR